MKRARAVGWLVVLTVSCSRTPVSSGNDAATERSAATSAAGRGVTTRPPAANRAQSPPVNVTNPSAPSLTPTRPAIGPGQETPAAQGVLSCPTERCEPEPGTPAASCCTRDGYCGFDLSLAGASCVRLGAPGDLHAGCPDEVLDPAGSVPAGVTLESLSLGGCCTPAGECGLLWPPELVPDLGCMSRETFNTLPFLGSERELIDCDPDADGGA